MRERNSLYGGGVTVRLRRWTSLRDMCGSVKARATERGSLWHWGVTGWLQRHDCILKGGVGAQHQLSGGLYRNQP